MEDPDLIGATMAGRGTRACPAFTLTAFGDRIYARMGQPPPRCPSRMGMGTMGNAPSFIVAIDRAAQGKLLWKRRRPRSPCPAPGRRRGRSRNAVFEGSPVADARSVYVAIDRPDRDDGDLRRLPRRRDRRHPLDSLHLRGQLDIDPFLGGGFEVSHRLLTLDGPTVYYQTNLGVVAALEAETGGIRWLATYPWQGGTGWARAASATSTRRSSTTAW